MTNNLQTVLYKAIVMQNGKEHFEKWRSFIEEKAGQISHLRE